MRFKRKSVEVEARQLTEENVSELAHWVAGLAVKELDPFTHEEHVALNMPTLEGVVRVSKGDYVVRTSDGEFSRCSERTFQETFEQS